MSRLTQAPQVETSVRMTFTETEMRALDALVGYGADAFLKVFYEKLGRHYMEPHEAGLRSLFKAISEDLPPILRRADSARKAFVLRNPVIRSQEEHDALIERVKATATKQPDSTTMSTRAINGRA